MENREGNIVIVIAADPAACCGEFPGLSDPHLPVEHVSRDRCFTQSNCNLVRQLAILGADHQQMAASWATDCCMPRRDRTRFYR